MSDYLHRTDTLGPCKEVTCHGEQKRRWVEFQLLDERGEPLANLPYEAVNDAMRANCAPGCSGVSDAQGVIRIEGLHPVAITLKMQANPLAEQLQTRRLRAVRAEPPLPGVGARTPLYGAQRSGFSPVEQQARAAGHDYHYLRIGQLCDQSPDFDPPLADPEQLPAYHFPDSRFAGFTVNDEALDRRHVLEVCPFRAWSLTLHHQPEYSLINAYNLGVMSLLAYSTSPETERGSVKEFFERQCQDLSRTPRVWDGGRQSLCVVNDVPFHDRYVIAKPLDTGKADPPEGDTQLFYAINATQVLVAWRGTEMTSVADLKTDVTLRPVKPEIAVLCETQVPCADLTPQGSVHLGFRDAFEVVRRVYGKDLGKTIPEAIDGRRLFICGHSLGGALGLVQAASLKFLNPLLYTYGMPRTFTLKAMPGLSDIVHFRHVNDIDPVPTVPPQAALDNYLYDLYGPLGTTLGAAWSLAQLTASQVFRHGDAYCHHGEIAMFFMAEQHTQQRGSAYPAYRSKEGLGAPYYNTINVRLPEKSKVFVVPSLSPDDDQQAEQAQLHFTRSLTAESRSRFFPAHRNLKEGRVLGATKHLMLAGYMPYLYGQLLECLDPGRDPLLERQLARERFEQQMQANRAKIPEDEYLRNRVFLELQSLLGRTLRATREAEGGAEALERFNAVADANGYVEKNYGLAG
ncbi:Lipase (class 3) [Pseudomonas sp. ok272]|uniref:lipase family protein n=1 Tax=unclassified Pseudomonas TaxID=196821 RepID=UPI0008B7662E|nr:MULTISPECIES: lipase family protein [unclassified Pseudomonas]SEN65700.1 Lipase (class 3) [Pseudomonas sp. ok272]SFN46043.1 Lipase (class 3) [Pseudomonas sp. ok602]